MQIVVSGETPFKALKNQFAVGPSESGYQVAFSVTRDGDYTLDPDAIVPANESLVYLGAGIYTYYMLSGNTDEVNVIV